ncbi:MAG TPA: TolC family protein [Bryobacteraceae bacterium]|nr:TolC family protein [Bryobacteraceae bacterium]
MPLACIALESVALAQAPTAPVKITMDQAIQMALQHNHVLQATRTTVQQSLANEVTANLRPNPTLFTDWEYLPLISGAPSGTGVLSYLQNSTEGDIGLSYMFERGQKRQHRLQAAKDTTSVVRAQVNDAERGLAFQVGQLFINAQLAESALDLAQQDVKSFQTTVDLSEHQYKAGAMSENDYLQIKLQAVQYQTDLEQATLARAQALSDLRQQLGYESVSANYDVAGSFEYQPLLLTLPELQAKAEQNRPDLRAAQLSISAANSQHTLAQANGKQDVTVSSNYSHVNGISAVTWSVSVPLPIFDRNQGNIAQTRYAINQAEETQKAISSQVLTDVRDAFEGLESNERVLRIYVQGALETSRKSRDITEYAYRRGAATLLDLLNAERSDRATQLAYRQSLAAYFASLEQLRQAVGSRILN